MVVGYCLYVFFVGCHLQQEKNTHQSGFPAGFPGTVKLYPAEEPEGSQKPPANHRAAALKRTQLLT